MGKKFSKEYQPTNRRKKEQPLTEALIKALNKNVEVIEFIPEDPDQHDKSGEQKFKTVPKKIKGVKLIADLMVKEVVKAFNQLTPITAAQKSLIELIQNRIDGPVKTEIDMEVSKGPDVVILPADTDTALANYQQVVTEPEDEEA